MLCTSAPFSLLCKVGESLLNGGRGLADDDAVIDGRFACVGLDVLEPRARLVEGIGRDIGVGEGLDPSLLVADVTGSGTGLTNGKML